MTFPLLAEELVASTFGVPRRARTLCSSILTWWGPFRTEKPWTMPCARSSSRPPPLPH